jgi:hypothetical protein
MEANMDGYLVGVAFWLFVAAAAVAGIVAEYKKRRLGVDLLRTSIERGQPLDPGLVERIFAASERQDRIDPMNLKLGGIITVAAGCGVVILAFFISEVAPIALYPILGAGLVGICVGIGLLVAAKVLADARARERANPSPQ